MRLGPTALLGLAGAGLAAVSSAQLWATASAQSPALREVEARGADVSPVALPLALVALASWGAVLVLRRRGRRVVALIGLLAAIGVALSVTLGVGGAADVARDRLGAAVQGVTTTTTAWPWAALVGAVVTGAAFVVALREAPRWPEMSGRYDAPTGAAAEPAARSEEPSAGELWRALDEGRDPTD